MADLNWEKQYLLVSPGAAQIDVDAFDVNMGSELSVAAFEIKKFNDDVSSTYQIYSLQKPPKLLRTIVGGGYFSAADTDLDTRVEIWTNDAAAINGFEHLELSELDFVPTIVLRFNKNNKLMDVSSEFHSYYNHQIDEARRALGREELNDFKNSDGKLLPVTFAKPDELEKLHNLRRTKIKVLEIVWAYLYSGREQEAWHALAEMWPASDLDRIQKAIANAQAHGIRAQVDHVSTPATQVHWKKHALIYSTKRDPENGDITNSTIADTTPKTILLRLPPPTSMKQALPTDGIKLDLIVDAAGKVRSAEATQRFATNVETDLIGVAGQWKFIPAFKDGRAVTSRFVITVAYNQ